jgi:hypothetical protein
MCAYEYSLRQHEKTHHPLKEKITPILPKTTQNTLKQQNQMPKCPFIIT